jgi:tetratricopeptide (TPR) repeat protein
MHYLSKEPARIANLVPDSKGENSINAHPPSMGTGISIKRKYEEHPKALMARKTDTGAKRAHHKKKRNAPDFLRKRTRLAVIPHTRPLSPVRQWLTRGAWYESYGDYAQASDAYKQAFKYEPDPGIAFVAGRAAESADNVEDAVEFYANILSNHPSYPSGQPSPEKGTNPWNEDLNVVLAVQSLFSHV